MDVIYDLVGGEFVEMVFWVIGWEGWYLVIGFVFGLILKFLFNLFLLKGVFVVGVFWGVWVMCDFKGYY